MEYDLIVYNGTIITVNPDFDIIENGIVCVKNNKIAQVKEKKDNTQLPKARQKIDAKGGLIIPGLVNTHTHLPMSLFRGLADDLPLMTWLNDHIFPAEASRINPESVKQGTLLSCAELLLSGTTTCCDGYFFENEVAETVCSTGLRAILGQGVIDFSAPGVADRHRPRSISLLFSEASSVETLLPARSQNVLGLMQPAKSQAGYLHRYPQKHWGYVSFLAFRFSCRQAACPLEKAPAIAHHHRLCPFCTR